MFRLSSDHHIRHGLLLDIHSIYSLTSCIHGRLPWQNRDRRLPWKYTTFPRVLHVRRRTVLIHTWGVHRPRVGNVTAKVTAFQ
jgi:hypothetical protein